MKRRHEELEEEQPAKVVKSPHKKVKQSSLSKFFPTTESSPLKSTGAAKPILVILPGASGNLSKAFKEALVPKLSEHFEIHIREGKWSNWNLTSKENVQSVLSHCPTAAAGPTSWYILGHSFGCRIILSMIINNLFALKPAKLILTSYPMYNGKATPERVELLQSLPTGNHVLCISGDKDEFLLNSPNGNNAKEIYENIISSMHCKNTLKLEMIANGGHGLIDLSKKQQTEAIHNIIKWINEFVEL